MNSLFPTARPIRRAAKITLKTVLPTLALGIGLVAVDTKLQAQTKPEAKAGAIQDYRLDTEDVIAITVANHPEYSIANTTIGTTGVVEMPMIGTVSVLEKTTRQVEQIVTQKFRQWLKKPDITVALIQQRPQRISVSGLVTNVGFYPIKPGWRISEAITAAGGVKGSPEDSRATLTRAGQAPQEINLANVLTNPQSKDNLVLRAEDRLDVTLLEPQKIQVAGEVLKPDLYDLRRAPRVLDALTAAGWLKGKPSATRASIIRRGKKIPVNLAEAIENKSPDANLALEPNDLLMLEEIPPVTVYVDGLVKNPGAFPIEPGTGVLQTISLAGGLNTAPEKTVASVRRGLQTLPVDLAKAVYDPAADIPLKNGDILQLREPQSVGVQVTGSVVRSGPQRLTPGSRLLDAISGAGSLNIKPEEAQISILRTTNGKQNALSIDAARLFINKDLTQNPTLQEGDFVTVLQIKPQTVFVTGEVTRPGAYELQAGDGVAELIARAGGWTANAALKGTSLTRRGAAAQTIDLSPLRRQEKPAVALTDGDFILVPRNTAQLTVLGAVAKPGPVIIPEDQPVKLGDAIGQAGGAHEKAKTKEIAIVRQVNGEVQRQIVSLDSVSNGIPATQIPLQNGDVIFIEQTREGLLSKLKNLTPFLFFFR